MFSPRDSMLPSHMSFGLDTYFNGQYNRNALRVTLCQKEIEQLIKQIFEHYQGHTTNDQPNKPNLLNVAAEKLRSIFNKLKIRGRGRQQDKEDEYKQEDQSPYFVISIRMNDVDIGMIPLNMDHNQGTVSQMKQALVSTLRNLFSNSDMKTFQLNTAMVINSRRAVVPTSVGVSLQIHQSMYIVGQVKGSIQANSQSKVKVNFHPNANWVQVQKMEAKATTYSSGVRSSRSVAVNIPLDIAFETTRNSNDQKQTKLSMKVPEKLTRLVVVNSLPTTYLQKVVDATSNSTNLHYYRIKAVENQQFRSQMREINTVMDPRKIFSLKEVVKAIMVGEQPPERRPNP
uniref:Vitellinogen open beta-sheet domain-containing protein n=1 Tax=Ditylenchus dipsaci TaxID=166011 RepID=A0A915DVF8_9BILA